MVPKYIWLAMIKSKYDWQVLSAKMKDTLDICIKWNSVSGNFSSASHKIAEKKTSKKNRISEKLSESVQSQETTVMYTLLHRYISTNRSNFKYYVSISALFETKMYVHCTIGTDIYLVTLSFHCQKKSPSPSFTVQTLPFSFSFTFFRSTFFHLSLFVFYSFTFVCDIEVRKHFARH